jgi:hypothetical protein
MALDVAATKSRGRPTKLTDDVAWRLVGLICAGHSITAAAAEIGVDRRSVERWRARAYSSRPEDAPFVSFERALTRGLIARTEVEQRISMPDIEIAPLAELYADLDDLEPLD